MKEPVAERAGIGRVVQLAMCEACIKGNSNIVGIGGQFFAEGKKGEFTGKHGFFQFFNLFFF